MILFLMPQASQVVNPAMQAILFDPERVADLMIHCFLMTFDPCGIIIRNP
jgi:hypothetical protein